MLPTVTYNSHILYNTFYTYKLISLFIAAGVKDNIFTCEIKAALDHYVCVHCLSVLIQLGTFKDQHCIRTPLGYLKRYVYCLQKQIMDERSKALLSPKGAYLISDLPEGGLIIREGAYS